MNHLRHRNRAALTRTSGGCSVFLQERQHGKGRLQHHFGDGGGSGAERQPVEIFQGREGPGTRPEQRNVSGRWHQGMGCTRPSRPVPAPATGVDHPRSVSVVALHVAPTPWAWDSVPPMSTWAPGRLLLCL